jgi:hypothetical protein
LFLEDRDNEQRINTCKKAIENRVHIRSFLTLSDIAVTRTFYFFHSAKEMSKKFLKERRPQDISAMQSRIADAYARVDGILVFRTVSFPILSASIRTSCCSCEEVV